MTDLEDRLQAYASAVLAQAPPVTADEVRARHRRRHLLRRVVAVAAMVLVALGAAAAWTVSDGEGSRKTVTAGPSAHPLTLDGHRDWQLDVLNGRIAASDDELAARFTDDFLEAVPPKEFREVIAPLVDMSPWRVLEEIERRGEEVLAVQLVSHDGDQARLTIHRSADGRVDGSTVQLAAPCAPAVAADAELDPDLRAAFEWVNGLLASGDVPPDDELRRRFAPSFLDAVPPDEVRAVLPRLQELGPYTVRFFEGEPRPHALDARVGVRTGEEARLSLSIELEAPYRITGFSVRTQPPCLTVTG